MRRAFTLIEMLVVIGIIAVLAAVVLGAVQRARQVARVEATKATILKIHKIMVDLWDDYRTRRLPIAPLATLPQFHVGGDVNNPLISDFPVQSRRLRVNALRDLMRMELPDRWSDVTGPPLILSPPVVSQGWGCGARATFDARRRAALARGASAQEIESWASAELLYLIVAHNRPDNVRFQTNEIGDKDGDGLKEFWDAWRQPIAWRRWPAGFVPDLGARETLQSRDIQIRQWSPDPKDRTVTDPLPSDDPERLAGDGWRLYPLIFSAGPDRLYDINRGTEAGGTYHYRLDADGNLNPCQQDLHQPPLFVGQPDDSTGPMGEPANGQLDHYDNIHNHSLLVN